MRIHLHIHRTRDAYNPSEARDPSGKWTEGGGGKPSGTSTAARAHKASFKPQPRKSPAKPKAEAPTPTKISPNKPAPVGGGKFALPGADPKKPAVARQRRTDTMVPAPADKTQWPEHLRGLKVPPAWKDILINPDPKAELQVSGVDTKGRRQPLYASQYMKDNAVKKFSRVLNLSRNFDKIVKKNNANLKSRDEGTKEHAQIIGLMAETGIRPGSERDTGAEKQAYGATTLQGQHVVTDAQGKVRLQFVGKKGVDLDLPVEDPEIARMLQQRALNSGPTGKLFPKINDGSLRRYVSDITNGQAKPKDFRTMVGTSTAMKAMQAMKKPANAKEYKKAVMSVARQVATKLGNTATIALNSYIVPQTFDSWKI